jgi:galactokinase
VINSGVAHNHASGDYRTRRAECERAAAQLGVSLLRDLGPSDLERVMALEDPLGRRARHVITENQRVLDAVAAMRKGDLDELGRLFHDSHASQRDDYEVSVPEIDLLVTLAIGRAAGSGATPDRRRVRRLRRAARTTSDAAEVARRISSAYAAQSGRHPTVLVPQLD